MVLLLISSIYQNHTYNAALREGKEDVLAQVRVAAEYIQHRLTLKVYLAETIAATPLLHEALLESNRRYGALSEKERAAQINQKDEHWQTAENEADPLIQTLLHNPAADYLKAQQTLLPNLYGEIFMTNRYGALVASTGKLSTFAHGHKYWWQAAYADGRIFLDDRGFDSSVQDFVLGIVIPVMEEGELIGILKCNVKITGPINDVIKTFNASHETSLRLVRSGGQVISDGINEPLSKHMFGDEAALLVGDKSGSAILENELIGYAPIAITDVRGEYGFGGSYASVDHIKGGSDKPWFIVVTIGKEQALRMSHDTNRVILISGSVFIVLAAALAVLFGDRIAKPIQKLSEGARRFGAGALDEKIEVAGSDEIIDLANSLNHMAANLSNTMISRDRLSQEVERRKRIEEQLREMAITDELTGVYNRHMFSQRLKAETGRSRRYKEPLSILMFDVDLFKGVNDRYGHDVGDIVLKGMVEVTKQTIRDEDMLARWGGEEFMIIMPHTDLAAALSLAERLNRAVAEHEFNIPQHITISIGVAELDSADTADTFIKRADKGLYQAKHAGRNRVVAA